MALNLYVIWQTENTHYDTYDSAVVAAASEEEARAINPGGGIPGVGFYQSCDWVKDISLVKVGLIGTAIRGTKAGVIIASFNAG